MLCNIGFALYRRLLGIYVRRSALCRKEKWAIKCEDTFCQICKGRKHNEKSINQAGELQEIDLSRN